MTGWGVYIERMFDYINPLKLPKQTKNQNFSKKAKRGYIPERKTMKRVIIAILLCVALCAGCGKSDNEDNHMMEQLDHTTRYKIYVHKDTGVMYFRSNQGGACVMLDADGKPLIYEE